MRKQTRDKEPTSLFTDEEKRWELAAQFQRCAFWRYEKADQHPDDRVRNLEAVAIFERLEETLTDAPQGTLDEFFQLFDGEEDVVVFQEMLRLVGFHVFPSTASELMARFISDRTGGR